MSACPSPPAANICGRPPRNALYKFDSIDMQGNYGDPNYGYTSPCGATMCNNGLPNGSTTSPTLTTNLKPPYYGPAACIPADCYNNPSAACVISESTCAWTGHGIYCQSNWDAPIYATNMPSCCAGLLSTSDQCVPEACPSNVSPGDDKTSGTCQNTMLGFCTPTNWIGSAQNVCDNYVKLAPQAIAMGVGPNGNVINPAQQIIQNAVNNTTLIQVTHIPPCLRMASLPKQSNCVANIQVHATQSCQLFVRPIPKSRSILKIMVADWYQYKHADAFSIMINTISRMGILSHVILFAGHRDRSPGTAGGTGATCGGTACILDGVTINLLNSAVGDIKLSQMCNNCSSCTGPCRCYIRDVTVNSINSTYAGSEIFSSCGTCFLLDNDDPPNATPIPCSSLSVTSNTSGGGGQTSPSFWDKTTAWLAQHKYIAGGVLVAIAVLLAIVVAYFVFAQKKSRT